MTSLMRRAPLAAAALLTLAATAAAQDAPAAPPAAPPVETAAPAGEPAAIAESQVGDRVRVRIRAGRSLDGVVLMKGTWERREDLGGWRAAKRDDRGAGVRLWWVNDLDGFIFVPATEVLEMKVLGTITNQQSEEGARRRREASERADAERDRMEQEKSDAEDTQAQAKFLLEEVEKAKREATAMALLEQRKKDDASKAKRWAELLLRFPPDKWTPETPKEIDKRRTTLHVFPNDDEIEFLKAFDEWKEAWTAWKSAQDASKDNASSAKPAASGTAK